jgi:hypothetical protein
MLIINHNLFLIVNSTGKIGACGFMPLVNRFFRLMPVSIIKIDNEMNPIKNEQGFCIQCQPGEPGLLIGFIGKLPTQQYSGYANNPKESSKKIIENVFRTGQRAFNSGRFNKINLVYISFYICGIEKR